MAGGDQVYRLYDEYTNHDGTQQLAVSPPMFATTLQQEYPEVEQTARVLMTADYKPLFEAGKNKFYEQSGYFVDSTFLEIFPIKFQYGSRVNALDAPNSIVLSTEMAQRFFGDGNPVGKQLMMDKTPYLVRGVFEKNPKFHLQFNYLVPLAAAEIPAERMQSWGWHQFFSYVKLKRGTNVQALEAKFQKEAYQKAKAVSNDRCHVGKAVPSAAEGCASLFVEL